MIMLKIQEAIMYLAIQSGEIFRHINQKYEINDYEEEQWEEHNLAVAAFIDEIESFVVTEDEAFEIVAKNIEIYKERMNNETD